MNTCYIFKLLRLIFDKFNEVGKEITCFHIALQCGKQDIFESKHKLLESGT